MITGADPVDETLFGPYSAPGVYMAKLPSNVVGVVEMDGPQHRYKRAEDSREHVAEKLPLVDVVIKIPSSYYYDATNDLLYVHTSDSKPPTSHEIELIHRGSGIGIHGKQYVTVTGFTFRHMGDAGISFFKGSGHGIALNNTSWGSRQGIRVYESPETVIYGNTLFRNDNSGVYFALASTGGLALGNVAYENLKGVRWSSKSGDAVALDNTVFENSDAGISLEEVEAAIVRRNRLVANGKTQLKLIRSEFTSEDNCFEAKAEQKISEFDFIHPYATLAQHQTEKHQDLHSKNGGCALPAKVDVHKLHEDSMAYTENARKLLDAAAKAAVDAKQGELPAGAASGEYGKAPAAKDRLGNAR
jgi:parallel beta-helix repeat protein